MTEDPPAGWVELLTARDWKLMSGRGGVLVISDEVNDRAEGGPKYHDRGCPFADRKHFIDKVVNPLAAGMRPNGRYFWVAAASTARDGGARACQHDSDPLNW